MSDEFEPEDVGYKKPPKKHQFKKGQSGNLAGRPKKYKSPINVLEEPISMRVNGKRREISAFEAAFRKTSQKALEGRLSAIKRFFKACDEANLLTTDTAQQMSGVWYPSLDPNDYPWHDFTEAELAEFDRLNKARERELFAPKGILNERETIVRQVALERHSVQGQRNKMTVLELIQLRLRQRAFKDGDEASLSYFMQLVSQTTIDTAPEYLGFLIVPARRPGWLPLLKRIDADTREEKIPIGPDHPEYDPSRPFKAQYESAAFRENRRRGGD